MTVRVTIRNDEPARSAALVSATVVTVGDATAEEVKYQLAAGQEVTATVGLGQFVMVDETEKDTL